MFRETNEYNECYTAANTVQTNDSTFIRLANVHSQNKSLALTFKESLELSIKAAIISMLSRLWAASSIIQIYRKFLNATLC